MRKIDPKCFAERKESQTEFNWAMANNHKGLSLLFFIKIYCKTIA